MSAYQHGNKVYLYLWTYSPIGGVPYFQSYLNFSTFPGFKTWNSLIVILNNELISLVLVSSSKTFYTAVLKHFDSPQNLLCFDLVQKKSNTLHCSVELPSLQLKPHCDESKQPKKQCCTDEYKLCTWLMFSCLKSLLWESLLVCVVVHSQVKGFSTVASTKCVICVNWT